MPKKSGKKSKQGTPLEEISADDSEDSHDLSVVNSLLEIKEKNPVEYNTLKYVFYATGLFFLFSLPFTDRLLELAIPACKSWLLLLVIKTAAFLLLFWIIVYITKKAKA